MSTANKGAQSSGDLPVRQGALSAEEIRAECPQFRILIIGKANAGKTTILRKVCNVKPDTKPIVYDAKGTMVKVWLDKFAVLAKKKLTKTWDHHDSHCCSHGFFNGSRDILLLRMSWTLLLKLGRPKHFYDYKYWRADFAAKPTTCCGVVNSC